MAPSEREEQDALRDHIRALQKEIGIEEGFLERLFNEADDWSFVVKIIALIEAALTHVITDQLQRPALADILANTELANLKTGRVALASALGLMDSDERRFVQKIAEMRNRFVHDVRRVSISIPEYIASLEPAEQKGVLGALRYFAPSEVRTIDFPNHPGVVVDSFVRDNPKLALWFSAMNFIAVLNIGKEKRALEAEKLAFEKRIHEINALLADRVARFFRPTVEREPRASTRNSGEVRG